MSNLFENRFIKLLEDMTAGGEGSAGGNGGAGGRGIVIMRIQT